MSSRRRPRSRAAADGAARKPAATPAPAGAASASKGGLPLIPLTAAAVLTGVLLVVVLVVIGQGRGGPVGANLASASASPPSASASASGPATTGSEPPQPSIEAPVHQTPADLAHGRTLGSLDAPVQLDVWSDFQCPACDAFTGSVEPYLIETYIKPGTARLTYHDMATIGTESVLAAVGARCADRQGQFWPYHDLLFANQAAENSGAITKDRSKAFAQSLGLDPVAFSACLDESEVEDAVRAETQQGFDAGIKQTPTLFANGIAAASANSSQAIADAVAAALERGSPSPAP